MRCEAIKNIRGLAGLLLIQMFFWSALLVTSVYAEEKQVTAVTEPWPPYMGPRLINNGFLPEMG